MSQETCPVCDYATSSRKKSRPCASCSRHFHLSCARLSQRASSSIGRWLCKSCLPVGASAPSHVNSSQPASNSVLSMKTISKLRGHSKIPIRIPKPIRNLASKVLTSSILSALDADSPDRWIHLLSFASAGLGDHAAQPTATSLATRLRHSLSKFDHSAGDALLNDLPRPDTQSDSSKPSSKKPPSNALRRRVRAKLVEGDVAGAVRVVASDSTLAKATPQVIDLLRRKHPTGPSISSPPIMPLKHLR